MKLLVNALFAVQVAAVAELIGTLAGTDLNPMRAIEVLSANNPGVRRRQHHWCRAAFPTHRGLMITD